LQLAEKLKELYKLTGMEVFKMPTIEVDEAMAWELVAMCVSHLDAQGSYAMVETQGWDYDSARQRTLPRQPRSAGS